MQQAKKDAAKNWRATLSGGAAQMNNNVNKIQDENRDHNAKEQSAVGVQERAQKDRLIVNQ